MDRRAQADEFWALPTPRPRKHRGAPNRMPTVAVFYAVAPLAGAALVLGLELWKGSPQALHDALRYLAVAALVCVPLSVWSFVRYFAWQSIVRTGSVGVGTITSLVRFDGRGFGYSVSVERAPGDAKLLRATAFGPKPGLEWIGESYAGGDPITLVTRKRGATSIVLGDRLLETRETPRKRNE